MTLQLHNPPASWNNGFTIVEVLLALILLVTGVLALASTASMTTRAVAAASRATRGAAVASAQLESLLARGCGAGASGGQTTTGEFTLAWSASSGKVLTDIVVVLQTRGPQGIRSDSFVTAKACVR